MENPVIQTSSGRVRGKLATNAYGYSFYYFDGIPYAQPPLGEKRFRAPVPAAKWTLIRDCTKSPNKCLQWNRRVCEIQGSEDCLYLNVNVRQLNARPAVPVMVYIHGGGFNTGDATRRAWAPDYFMMKDVVFITIGYRLGMFGFASFSDKSLNTADNCGVLDVILALKWIRANCMYFNGDPENITLFGHSSGSCVTHMLMQTPSAKGLFHKAILLAGFNMNEPSFTRLEFRLAQHLGFEGSEQDQKALCEFLTNVDANKLVNFDVFTEEEKMLYPDAVIFPIWPIADGTLISKDIVAAQRKAWSNSIPLMMGSNSTEALMLLKKLKSDAKVYEMWKSRPQLMLHSNLKTLDDAVMLGEIAKRVKDIHFGDKEMTIENYECALEIESYNFLYHDQHRLMQSRLQNATAPTYVYRFDFDSPTFNFYRIRGFGVGSKGVGHCDELGYLFVLPDTFKLDANTPEYRCIELMIETFYTFSKTSDPNNPILQPNHWEPIQRGMVPHCLNINYEWTRRIPQPEYEKCCAIDEAYKLLNKDLY
ncbi:esterase B1 [Stomoxys calcitrans]|uniref:esterase B1 n=1 Tax=Stomoxys calcitrans TaxID=35570 RepID=UPI0027E33D57|nr:esterase B1 [Stomoxys calcitrans]